MTNTKNTKRALLVSVMSLFLCFVMLLGTTYAWFTDSVTSANNIIKSGKLEVGMYWADGAADVPTIGSNAWNDASKGPIFTDDVLWEPGYAVAKHILITNEGSLDLNYELRITTNTFISELANVIDVYYFAEATKLTRATIQNGIKLGTLADIMGTTYNISNTVCGSLVVSDTNPSNDSKTITLAFVMQESAGNEYQELSLADFSVQMIATQMSSEKDSFGNDYDANALSPAVPAAAVSVLSPKQEFTFTSTITNRQVTVLEKGLKTNALMGLSGSVIPLELDAAYQFEPSQTAEEMELSEYKYYIADFVVSADRDVPANSIALAGYYDFWCSMANDNWVALANADGPIDAGTEIRLVQLLGAAVHYKDICQYGNDGVGFVCGLADLTGQNAGTTVTVKLCLFKTDADPNGSSASTTEVADAEPIVIGEFKYTFPYPSEEATVVNNNAELAEALTNGKQNIKLANGTYQMTSAAQRKILTLSSVSGNAADVIIEVVPGGQGEANGQLDYSFDGSNVCFNNVTIKTNSQLYAGFTRLEATYNNCIIQNTYNLATGKAVFNECVFNITNEYVRVGGVSKAEFNGCTFNTDGRAILVFQDGSNVAQEVIVKDCTFNATAAANTWNGIHVAAVSIDGSADGISYNVILNNNTVDSDFSGLWQDKTAAGNITVTVDGTVVLQPTP